MGLEREGGKVMRFLLCRLQPVAGGRGGAIAKHGRCANRSGSFVFSGVAGLGAHRNRQVSYHRSYLKLGIE